MQDCAVSHPASKGIGQVSPRVGTRLEADPGPSGGHRREILQALDLIRVEPKRGWGLEDHERRPEETRDSKGLVECPSTLCGRSEALVVADAPVPPSSADT